MIPLHQVPHIMQQAVRVPKPILAVLRKHEVDEGLEFIQPKAKAGSAPAYAAVCSTFKTTNWPNESWRAK